jgi:hypothetical protein
VAERGLGFVVGHRREIPGVVARLAESAEERDRVRRCLAAMPENRAVYEVLEIIGAAVGKG